MKELLDYWIQHPEALGTEEAIVEWWLLEQRIQQATLKLRSVLRDLESNGFVVRAAIANGRACYRLNREKHGEILAWLQSR